MASKVDDRNILVSNSGQRDESIVPTSPTARNNRWEPFQHVKHQVYLVSVSLSVERAHYFQLQTKRPNQLYKVCVYVTNIFMP